MARIELVLRGTPAVEAKLKAIPEQMSRAMKRALSDSIMRVYRRTVENLTGRVLRVKTGRLRQSMQTSVDVDGSEARIGTNVEYARIHEYGGTTRPHTIRPQGGKALRFAHSKFVGPVKMTKKRASSGVQFAAFVNHPGAHIPARPYMRPALRDSLEDIRAIFARETLDAVKGAS